MDLFSVFALTGLVYIGLFKGAIDFPVDLTAVFAGLVVLLVAHRIAGVRGHLRISTGAVLFVALCIPAMVYPVMTPDTIPERVRDCIPLIVAAGAAAVLFTDRRVRLWVWAQVVVGVLLVGTGSANALDYSRFTGAGSNTIGAGRAAGVAVVVLLVLIATTRGHRLARLAGLAVTVWLVQALVSTGSRGPVFACAAAVLLVAVFAPGRHRVLRTVAAAAAVVGGFWIVSTGEGTGAARIMGQLGGGDASSHARLAMWQAAWQTIVEKPCGIGWGNFWTVLAPGVRLDSGYRQYPHNLILEVAVSAGWAAGVGVVILLVWSLNRMRRQATTKYGAAMFAIGLFFVLNAMVSGDVNDNRMMWAALAAGWVSPVGRRSRAESLAARTAGDALPAGLVGRHEQGDRFRDRVRVGGQQRRADGMARMP